ncbi:MAG: KOW domain-containing RNA-binding protein [Lachnospiraceae bacterium]|nr:KOW domain-containing RNA-binding protein [Lachnospiraceae bacterium]
MSVRGQAFLAKSKAGHDRNHVYVVLKCEDDMAYLVNGTTRKVDNPKRKKLMHIQPITHLSGEITEVLEHETLTDEDVIDVLERYLGQLN